MLPQTHKKSSKKTRRECNTPAFLLCIRGKLGVLLLGLTANATMPGLTPASTFIKSRFKDKSVHLFDEIKWDGKNRFFL